MVIISKLNPKAKNDVHVITVDASMFRVSTGFVIASIIICGILAALYTIFW